MRGKMFLAALLVVGWVAAAQADIIYQDAFHRRTDNGDGTYSVKALSGTVPDVVGSTAWTANALWGTQISGSTGAGYATVNASSAGNYSAWLPVTIQQGYVYTLSASFQTYSGASYGTSGKYGMLGFAYSASTPTGTTAFSSVGTAYAIEKTGASTTDCLEFGRGYTACSYTSSKLNYVTYSQSQADDRVYHSLKVVLDTTGSSWTLGTYLDNATTPYNTYTYTTNPSVNYVGFGATRDLTAANFTLTRAVPEPSTFAMLVAGAVGALACAWRKRK